MVYSSAYWDDGVDSLDDAQSAKVDYALRKLRLRPGERLLDIGCGWGALVIRAAQLGAQALGVTLSRPHRDEAQRRIAAAGVAAFARVEFRDYRELRGELFDKIVSVGMFEHVGRSKFAEYFRAAYGALRPGGLFLITRSPIRAASAAGNQRALWGASFFPTASSFRSRMHYASPSAPASNYATSRTCASITRRLYALGFRIWSATVKRPSRQPARRATAFGDSTLPAARKVFPSAA
jgi:cyclopropane fatty-acyl-phospholipid synthase-like methyltransferase